MVACREHFERVLDGRKFAFSLLVHSDDSSPMVDFLATSSVLQVGLNPALVHIYRKQDRRDLKVHLSLDI